MVQRRSGERRRGRAAAESSTDRKAKPSRSVSRARQRAGRLQGPAIGREAGPQPCQPPQGGTGQGLSYSFLESAINLRRGGLVGGARTKKPWQGMPALKGSQSRQS